MAWISAALVLPFIKRLKRAESKKRYTVWILPKDGFTQDVMSALDSADDVEVLAMPRLILREIFRTFLPNSIDDNNYASAGSTFDHAKLRYRDFLRRLFKALSHFRQIDAVVTGNFGYRAERELATAMSELRIPFIALHKENLKTPGRVTFFEHIYKERRGAFTGHSILVYNQIEKDLQLRAGVAATTQIQIIGMPRLDRIHSWRRSNTGTTAPRKILFFLFSPLTGMPRIVRKGATTGEVYLEDDGIEEGENSISLDTLCTETCLTILKLARENPDIEVVVKTKGRQRDIVESIRPFGLNDEQPVLSNLRVIHSGDVLPLIAEASVVCGFNSTALLEAVAAGKPVVLPWFAEAERADVNPYVIDLRPLGDVVHSPVELHDLLIKYARSPRPVPAQLGANETATLEHWTGNVDGCAGERTRRAILAAIGRGV
ncbi:hypothetical protein DFP91_0173 [Pseudorhodoplanes sinuspersici]|nr:hypothetical protein DFP91_0173 [Pseudorhodoplanes sinuspersici]